MCLIGFAVIAAGEILAEPMLAALNVPAETMSLAPLYLRVFLLGLPSILLYNFEAAIFRPVGITRMPLQALMVSTVLNIALDLIFVPVPHWGVVDVAAATVIAYTVSAATLFVRLLKIDSMVRVNPRDLRIDLSALKRIVKIGLPARLWHLAAAGRAHHTLRLRYSLLLGVLRLPHEPHVLDHHDGLSHQPGHHGRGDDPRRAALPSCTHLSPPAGQGGCRVTRTSASCALYLQTRSLAFSAVSHKTAPVHAMYAPEPFCCRPRTGEYRATTPQYASLDNR